MLDLYRMTGWIRMCSVVTAFWIVCVSGLLMVEYFRLDAQRELPYGAHPPPAGFVLDPKTDSLWFQWALPSDSAATYQPKLRPRLGRVAAVLLVPVALVWVTGVGCGWTRKGFSSEK